MGVLAEFVLLARVRAQVIAQAIEDGQLKSTSRMLQWHNLWAAGYSRFALQTVEHLNAGRDELARRHARWAAKCRERSREAHEDILVALDGACENRRNWQNQTPPGRVDSRQIGLFDE